MNITEIWNEGMRAENPGCIFGLLQLILGKQSGYEQESIYLGNDDGEGSHTEV
jgi:hypothetical protein